MQIVLADDDKFSREALVRTLEDRTHHQITAVADGNLALEHALSRNPDALVLDWVMPTMTGTEVCRRVRQAELPRQPYVLVVTAKNQREDLLEGLDAGVDDLLSKPVAPDLLVARLAAAESQRNARRSAAAIVRHALHSAKAEGNGELVVRDGAMTARVFFHGGEVAWAHLSNDRNSLFELLSTEASIEPEMARGVVEECRRTGARLSDTLENWGLTDRAHLRNSLQIWVRRKLDAILSFEHPEALFLPSERPYAEDMLFDLDELLPPPSLPGPLPVQAPIARPALWSDAFADRDVPSALESILDRCMRNEGLLGVAILNRETGACLGHRGLSLNPNIAWTFMQTLNVIANHEPVDDAVVTTTPNYHLVCFMPDLPGCFAYAVVDSRQIMLATARFQLKRALQG